MFKHLIPERRSLLARLTIRLALTTVVIAAALLLYLQWQLRENFDTIHDRSLTNQARDIARHIERRPDGSLSLSLPELLTQAYGNPEGEYFFEVRELSGVRVFASSQGTTPLAKISDDPASSPQFSILSGPGETRIFAARVPVSGNFGKLSIRVGQTEKHADVLADEVLEEFFEKVGWVLPSIFAMFLVINIATVRRSLAPIQTISAKAATIGPADTLPDTGLPSEISPFVQAVNSAFTRLGDALVAQREFTADAAHELRTPLAVLAANIDTLSDGPAKAELRHDLQSISRIVEQLLKAAQLDAFVSDKDQVADLGALAVKVAAQLGHLAIERGKSISVVVPDSPVLASGDNDILQHALTNLVENAVSHTPEGTDVVVTVESGGKIHVDDSGNGIPENERDLVFKRFWRRNRNTPGAGIGLSIVAKIAATHHGSVHISDSPSGGARFTLSLPLHQ